MQFDIDIAIFIGFITINLVCGILAGRGVKTLRSYAIGERNFSTITIVSTIVATWIGGGFFSIAISQTYQDGIWFIAAGSGDIIAMLIIGYILAPRMAKFLGKLSVAETMGDLYGKHIRIVTSISSILLSVGAISMQIKVLSSMFNYFFHFSSVYAVLISSAIIVFYSAFGGIRAVAFTDILQFLTFGTIIPTFVLFIWDSFGHVSITELLLTNPLFDYHELGNYNNPNFFPYLSLFIYSTIPALDPAIFQRLLIAKNIRQIRQSFSIAAIVGLCIFLISCSLGAIMYLHNGTLNPNNLVMYILDNYSYTGLKGLVLIGITAMIMSTADSYINAASVTFAHDFCKPLGLDNKTNELFIPRVVTFLIGTLAVSMALLKNNILDLLLLIGNFYAPIIMIPLIMAILGFRTTTKAVFLAIAAGIATVIIWRLKLQDLTNVDSVLPGTIANFIVLLVFHFTSKKVKNKHNTLSLTSPTGIFLRLIHKIKKINFTDHFAKQSPKHGFIYTYAGFATLLNIFITISLDKNEYQNHLYTINLLQAAILFISTSLIFNNIWLKLDKKFHGLIWHLLVFIGLVFFSSWLVLIAKFSQLSLVIFILNLTIVGILMSWQTTFIMTTMGVLIAILTYDIYIGNSPELILSLPELKLKIIYILFMTATFLLAFFKPKQEEYNLIEEKSRHLELKVGDQKKELSKLYEFKNELLRNLEHETRTPITGITSLGQVLWANYDKFNEEQRRNATKDIADSSERLTTLVNNLIDLSKLNNINYQLNKSQVNLSDLVYERLELCKKLYIQDKDQEDLWFNLRIDNELTALCDQYYISRTIDNIIVNAIQYCKQGTITIELKPEQNHTIVFSVKDEGIGIPKDELFEVFNPFTVSSKTKTPAGGRGIGLALSKKVIEAHNGQIWAKPNQDKGVTVAFSLPI
jgi:Na+/proline symporter/signal transduction histidine kinase